MKNIVIEKNKTYKNPIEKIEEFSLNKIKSSFFDQLLSAILAGICVGFGFTALLVILCSVETTNNLYQIVKYLTSFIFCTSIILCCLLGASLFTGNCICFITWLQKKIKLNLLLKNWLITIIGNLIGTFLFALFIFLIGLFAKRSNNDWRFIANIKTINLIYQSVDKIKMPFWQSFLSGILCNIIVAASILSWIIFKNKSASILCIFFLIASFTLGGYNHVVASSYIGWLGWLLSTIKGAQQIPNNYGVLLFFNCLIPAFFGNLVGGVLITWIYFKLNKKVKNTEIA